MGLCLGSSLGEAWAGLAIFFLILFNFFYQNFIIFHKKRHCASDGLGLGPSLEWALSGLMGRARLQSDGLGPSLGSRTRLELGPKRAFPRPGRAGPRAKKLGRGPSPSTKVFGLWTGRWIEPRVGSVGLGLASSLGRAWAGLAIFF